MKGQAKLLAAENSLNVLMADVTRAMEKAQKAIAQITEAAAAAAETPAAPPSR
jgi:hypothetical protein